MFRLVSGSVRLSVICEEGRELLYPLFGPGDCFGTSSVVDGELRPHRADAFESVQLPVLNTAAINRLRGEYPVVHDPLLQLLSRHMTLLSFHLSSPPLYNVLF